MHRVSGTVKASSYNLYFQISCTSDFVALVGDHVNESKVQTLVQTAPANFCPRHVFESRRCGDPEHLPSNPQALLHHLPAHPNPTDVLDVVRERC